MYSNIDRRKPNTPFFHLFSRDPLIKNTSIKDSTYNPTKTLFYCIVEYNYFASCVGGGRQ